MSDKTSSRDQKNVPEKKGLKETAPLASEYKEIWNLIKAEKTRTKESREKATRGLLGTYDNPLTMATLNKVFKSMKLKGSTFLENCYFTQVTAGLPAELSYQGCDGIIGPISWKYIKKWLEKNDPALLKDILKEHQTRRTRVVQHVHKDHIINGKGRGITYDVSPESLSEAQEEMNKACKKVVDILNSSDSPEVQKRKITAIIHNYERRSTTREAIVNIPGAPKHVKFRFRLGLICYASSKWAEKYMGYKLGYYCSVRDYKWQMRLWKAALRKRKRRYYAYLRGGGVPVSVLRKHDVPRHYWRSFRRGDYSHHKAIQLITRLTRRYCAYPGTSNHQMGYATDFKLYRFKNGKWSEITLPKNAGNRSFGSRKLMAILRTFPVLGSWREYKHEDWHKSYKPHNGKWARV